MAKRKRAPGGGMKPRGEFSALSSPLSIRMPDAMRAELEASRGRRSLSQELLRRLQKSFNQDRERSRDPALRALCFLIGELAESTTSLGPIRHPSTVQLWRSDPFLFRAFKLAVGKLLDALEPAGEMKSPVTKETAERIKADFGSNSFLLSPEAVNFMLKTYKSPEALSNQIFSTIWSTLLGVSSPDPRNKETMREIMSGDDPQLLKMFDVMWAQEFYGMQDARRDLGIKPQGKKP